jgi:hypothetical protein
MKQRRVAVELQIGNVKLPAQVAHVGTLDLDDARSQVSQSQSRQRPGEEDREVENQ